MPALTMIPFFECLFRITEEKRYWNRFPGLRRESLILMCISVVRTIEILTEDRAEIITAFGDSLVQQGHWFQEWYKLLLQKGKRSVLLNEGISGNRVLRDASSSSRLNSIFGEAGIKRIRKDVFGRYQPDQVILAEGINDLVHPGDGCSLEELPCAKELIEGIKELDAWCAEKEAVRFL